MDRVIVVCGPTATGKTALGIELALRLGGEIVSADSMQVYRRMDIGTAKATSEERARVPHHMLDVCEPWEDYSVSRYVQEASAVCDGLLARGKVPVIVGGTGLYIDSLIAGRDFAGRQEGDEALRRSLDEEYGRIGGEAMLEKLRAFDPERAAKLHPGDRRRIVRAMEIYALTGKTITQHDRETRERPPRYQARKITLSFENRADLYARIDRRVEQMVSAGLFDEVEALLREGLSPACTAMQAIGYKEAVLALEGSLSLQEAVERIQLNSRRYAKRHLTWFGRDPEARWLRWEKEPLPDSALEELEKWLALPVSTVFSPRSGL